MAYSATDSVVETGSGRSRLPARLRAASFGATVAAAILALTKGPQLPNYTTTQRNALTMTTGDKGCMVYDTTLSKVAVWSGTAWKDVNNVGTI